MKKSELLKKLIEYEKEIEAPNKQTAEARFVNQLNMDDIIVNSTEIKDERRK